MIRAKWNIKRRSELSIKRSNNYNKKCKNALQWTWKVLNFYKDYTRMVSKAKYKLIHGEVSQ